MKKEKEIKALRGAARKVYYSDDGHNTAVYTPYAVHYYDDETGEYRSFDNHIVRDDEGRYYVNKAGNFKARFSREDENEELFVIEKGMYKVTVSANRNAKNRERRLGHSLRKENIRKANAMYEADNREADIKELETAETDVQETVLYSGVYDGADLEYSLNNAGVKENIIINEKKNVYHYSFIINCENVTCSIGEDGIIRFYSCEDAQEIFYIPAPFMYDSDGDTSYGVTQEIRTLGEDIVLTLSCDSEWINSSERTFPVTVDPQINLSRYDMMKTFSYSGGTITDSTPINTIGGKYSSGTSGQLVENRMYIKINLIKDKLSLMKMNKAEIKIRQKNRYTNDSKAAPRIGLYMLSGNISVGTNVPQIQNKLIDYAVVNNKTDAEYIFDITEIVENARVSGNGINLVLKYMDSSDLNNGYIDVYSSEEYYEGPELLITYEKGISAYKTHRSHTHDIGRFGKATVDLLMGFLAFDCMDFEWAGNRMPVTMKHMYCSLLKDKKYTENVDIGLDVADFSSMNIGYGFRLNVMQSIKEQAFYHNGERNFGYIYTDGDGKEIYLRKGGLSYGSNGYYDLYESDDKNIVYDKVLRQLTVAEDLYQFDDSGHLLSITDANGNKNIINYTSGKITSVTDGAGRSFDFAYTSGGYLSSITAPDDTNICYSYSGGYLTGITYPDGTKAEIAYSAGNPVSVLLKGRDGKSIYRVNYSYNSGRVQNVSEYGVQAGQFIKGLSSSYSYNIAARTTEVVTTIRKDECECETEDTVIKTVYTIDDDGNIAGEYAYTKETGNVQATGEAGINPYMGENGMSYVKVSDNMLINHGFSSLTGWSEEEKNCSDVDVTLNKGMSMYGNTCVKLVSNNKSTCGGGINQYTYCSMDGGAYTFSAYVNVSSEFTGTDSPGVFVRVTDTAGKVLAESEHLYRKTDGYVRLAATFENYKGYVLVKILVYGKGTAYADGAQLEKGEYAGDYNFLVNGSFEKGLDGWSRIRSATSASGIAFNKGSSLKFTGNIDWSQHAYQDIVVNTTYDTRETFTLSGWAKASNALPYRERETGAAASLRLRALIKYDGVKESDEEEFVANFTPCTEGWQFVSVQFKKTKFRNVKYIRIYCDYDFNAGEVYFDAISLVRDNIETGLVQSDFVKPDDSKEENVQNGEQSGQDESGTDDGSGFKEYYDAYGNAITETTFKDGMYGTIYRSFGYNDCCCGMPNSGNDKIRETDARGKSTLFKVDPDTSKVTEVTDRCGSKTKYEYDSAGRTTKTSSYNNAGTKLSHIAYEYNSFDNITGITRSDGMKYVLSYNQFHNLSAIGISGKTGSLVSYEYKEGNGKLKSVGYANGDVMKLTYNRIGQVMSEKWYNRSNSLTAHYKYTYDGSGNIVRSVDIISKKEYNYMYENGRLKRASENSVTVNSDGIVTKRTLLNSILYSYDEDGQLVKKLITSANKSEADTVINYEYDEQSGTVAHLEYGNTKFTSHSGKDSFGRKSFDELQTGLGYLTRQYTYHKGSVTNEHKNNGKLKSGPVTQLVKRIELSDGRLLSYEYDNEERITRVTEYKDTAPDVIVNDTHYTYDPLGQLIKEVRNNVTVNEMTYDNLGNIKKKNGVTYTYSTGAWKDQLIGFGSKSITYDAQGNPLNYLGHTLTWEKGRQLKKFDSNTYTYNANGIRTGKNVNGTAHSYRLDGTKILSEKWGGNTLIPLYNNEDEVCGIKYNGTAYYFLKNLQGDVISITDSRSRCVAEYTYDAWGVCKGISDTTVEKIASINPFRYRSYYYDSETGLYYLQSRYYDPAVGRFVNADDVTFLNLGSSVLSYNFYANCDNDPINYIDDTGNKKKKVVKNENMLSASRWLLEFVQKMTPNVYVNSKKSKTIFDGRFLGVSLTIKVGLSANTNPNGIFGILMDDHAAEITVSSSVNQKVSFFIGAGITWRKTYMNCGWSYTVYDSNITCAITIELGISHLTAAALVVGCAAAPYLSTFVASVITAISASAASAGAMLIPLIPKFVELVAK